MSVAAKILHHIQEWVWLREARINIRPLERRAPCIITTSITSCHHSIRAHIVYLCRACVASRIGNQVTCSPPRSNQQVLTHSHAKNNALKQPHCSCKTIHDKQYKSIFSNSFLIVLACIHQLLLKPYHQKAMSGRQKYKILADQKKKKTAHIYMRASSLTWNHSSPLTHLSISHFGFPLVSMATALLEKTNSH